MRSIITKFILFFCFCLSVLFALAIFGYFEKYIVLTATIITFVAFIVAIAIKIQKRQVHIEKFDLAVVFIIIVFSLFLSCFHHDLPRGRDDASYLVAAVKLSETKSLSFDDKITHTFTGFRNLEGDRFTSQFLPGYVVYLATFFNFGGLSLLFWANSLLIFLSLCLIYFLGKSLDNSKTGIISLLFLGSFYTTFWFSRRLVSENLLMPLFWLAIFLFFEAIKEKKIEKLFLGFFPITLALFVRGETIVFWLIYLFFIILFLFSKRFPRIPFTHAKTKFSILALFIILNFFLFGYYLKAYNGLSYFISQFYLPFKFFFSIFIFLLPFLIFALIIFTFLFFLKKEILLKFGRLAKTNLQKIIFFLAVGLTIIYELALFFQKNINWNFYQIQYGFKILTFYLLPFYILIILLGLYFHFFKKEELFLTLLVAPSFIFLIRSNIAQDLPWFLRHFYPIFIPFIFLLASLVLTRSFDKFKNYKKTINFIVGFFVVVNLLLSLPIITFSEHKNIKNQLESFSKNFKQQDLIIMTPGWEWQKWAYPLHYLYHLNILPNLNLYPEKKFKKEIKDYKTKFDNDAIIFELKKDFENKSFEEFRNLIKKYDDVYLLLEKDDLIIYPYKENNLQFTREIHLNYRYLTSDASIAKYIEKNSKNLNLKELNAKIRQIPPQNKQDKELVLKLYKAKNKNEIIRPIKQYDKEDIENFRKILKRWLR